MERNYKKGFTLIELLVVIAIIGILSAVVLASLNAARSRGSDASVKSNLNNIRSQAELFRSVNGDLYVNGTVSVCGTTAIGEVQPITTGVAAAARAAGVTWTSAANNSAAGAGCVATSGAAGRWAAWAPLANPTTAGYKWCVDSTGAAKESNITNATVSTCP